MKEDPRGHRLRTRGRALSEGDWQEYFDRLEEREDERRRRPAKDEDGDDLDSPATKDRKRGRERSRSVDLGDYSVTCRAAGKPG